MWNELFHKKTLDSHINYKHNKNQIVFLCPVCKDTFANAWSVYRHLYKVHRKTATQIRRLREQIHNSCIRKEEKPIKKEEQQLFDKAESQVDVNLYDFQLNFIINLISSG